MTEQEFFQKVKDLFTAYQDDFGCRNSAAVDRQCEYDQYMSILLCEYQGPHDFVPDICGIKEHDFCARCGMLRKDVEIEN